MIALSYTCMRDIDLVNRLNDQITSMGIRHWAFFESREMYQAEWFYKGTAYLRRDGGDNGMGRDGSMAKIDMLRKAYEIADSLNLLPCTFVDIDSDVYFNNPQALLDMECVQGQFKGFSGHNMNDLKPEPPNRITKRKGWYYATGCLKSFHSDDLKKLIDIQSHDNYMSVLIGQEITPSEDAYLSYMFQNEFGCEFVNMKERYKLAVQSKDYEDKTQDIIS